MVGAMAAAGVRHLCEAAAPGVCRTRRRRGDRVELQQLAEGELAPHWSRREAGDDAEGGPELDGASPLATGPGLGGGEAWSPGVTSSSPLVTSSSVVYTPIWGSPTGSSARTLGFQTIMHKCKHTCD